MFAIFLFFTQERLHEMIRVSSNVWV